MKLKKIIFYTLSLLTLAGFVTSAFSSQTSKDINPPIEKHYDNSFFIGELDQDWNFPSDHLPIGASIGDINIAFWNILNKKYLSQIENNSQGLKDSSIMKDNFSPNSKTTLTVREEKICSQIFEMISHSTHPHSLIALQETSKEILNYLTRFLPERWVIITPPDQLWSQDIFLYDSKIFDYVDHSDIRYRKDLPKTIFSLTLREKKSNKIMKFIQSHIPEGPVDSAPGCQKFSDEVLLQFNPEIIQVLMGDMGKPPIVIEKNLNITADKLKMKNQPFSSLAINYPTHIDQNCNAEWIDNFFLYLPPHAKNLYVSTSSPNEICSMAPNAAKLLQKYL
jgi:hypothetical protein